jgi:hypothetical protein
MRLTRTKLEQPAEPPHADANATNTANAFAIIWRALADVLGTSATAALIRRARSRAARRRPALLELVIGIDSWSLDAADSADIEGLHELVAELGSLLLELTGGVVVTSMKARSELEALRLAWRERTN